MWTAIAYLLRSLRADRHRRRGVEQQVARQPLGGLVLLDVDLAGPGGDPPVDGADRVAPLVGPRLDVLDAGAQERRAGRCRS